MYKTIVCKLCMKSISSEQPIYMGFSCHFCSRRCRDNYFKIYYDTLYYHIH